jgi:hypothetical protein
MSAAVLRRWMRSRGNQGGIAPRRSGGLAAQALPARGGIAIVLLTPDHAQAP